MVYELASASLLRKELENAEGSLNLHLQAKTQAEAEIERWQQVVDQLKHTISLIESPANVARKKVLPVVKNGRRATWWGEIEAVLKRLDGPPTRKELMNAVFEKNPQGSFGSITAAVYNAVNSGKVVWKNDRCYLPGTEPRPV